MARRDDRGSQGYDGEHRKKERCSPCKINKTISLAFLAPELVKAGHRRHAPARHGRRPAVRSPRRMVTPAPSARPRRSITALSNGSPHRTCLFPGKRDLGSTPPRISLSSAFLTHPPHKQLCHLHVIAHFPLSLSMGGLPSDRFWDFAVFLQQFGQVRDRFKCKKKCLWLAPAPSTLASPLDKTLLYRSPQRRLCFRKRDLTTGENVGRKACRMEFAVSRE